ncbi:hypothetical protein [Microbacterium sp. XT11]|uniref:hypothetical protein n=1 Tax=Microbacterium sp. XT11 TaxID=367477 RepID=UPI0012FA7DE0|nr:hypothetical protein [Microbacterium sp. XT11]
MIHRHCFARWSGAISIATSAALFAGCSAAPAAPVPTPTPTFANKEEAFTAAEETYRAFTKRLNEVDLADTSTFEPLFDLSSGAFEKADRKAYSQMHAEGYTMTGETKVQSFTGKAASPPYETVIAHVCLDTSSVVVLDSAGVSQVSPDRPDVYSLDVTFVMDDQGRMLIDAAEKNEEEPCESE